MKTQISPSFLSFANKVARVPFLKSLLKPLYYPYKNYIRRNRNKVFRENAIGVLSEFDRVMSDNGFHYSVFAGTLLGAVREKGFIKHDMDIDTMMWFDEYSPLIKDVLVANGFKLHHVYEADGGKLAKEDTYIKNGVNIDIFFVYSDHSYDSYQCDFFLLGNSTSPEDCMKKYGHLGVRRREYPVGRSFVRLPFEGISVSAIQNYEDWLTARYGDDYMIPNPNYSDKPNPHVFCWDGVYATYICSPEK